MSNGKWIYKKYHIGHLGIILSVIICVLCLFFVGVCIYFEKTIAISASTNTSINGFDKFYYENYVWFGLLKDMATIIASILGSSCVISLALEVNDANSMYVDFFEQDVISTPVFYKNIPSDKRLKMLKSIETIEYFDENAVVEDMYESIRNRLQGSKFGYTNYQYYMDYCEYKVTCIDKGSHFEKNIVRTMKFKTYKDSVVLKELSLGKYKNIKTKINGLKPFEIISLRVNGKPVDLKTIKTQDVVEPDDVLEAQVNYTSKQHYIYDSKITLNNKEDTTIIFEYKSRTEKDDIHSTFRCSVPCKQFVVSFSVIGEYTLIPIAFGFCDRAQMSPNSNNKNEATVHFNQWIFEDDGVVIVLNNSK